MSTAPRTTRRRLTHCSTGHPYTEENTRIGRDNKYYCRTCNRLRIAARRLKARAQEIEPRYVANDWWIDMEAAIVLQAIADYETGIEQESAAAYLRACGLMDSSGRIRRR